MATHDPLSRWRRPASALRWRRPASQPQDPQARALAAQRLGVEDPAAPPAEDPLQERPSLLRRALTAGGLQVRSAIPATGATLAGIAGQEETALELAGQAARTQRQAAELLPDAPGITEIEDVGDAGDWAASVIGRQLPILATQAAAGLAGGVVGRRVARRLGRPLSDTPAAVARSRRLTRRGTVAGAAAGSGASSTALSAGELTPQLLMDPEAREDFSVQELSQRALGGSLAAGALDTLPTVAVLRRLGVGQAAEDVVRRSLGRRVARGAFTQAATEAPTEAAQEAILRGTHSLVNENIGIFDDEGLDQMLEGAAAGALVGGLAGGLSGLPGPALAEGDSTDPADPIDREIEREQAQMDREEMDAVAARRRHERLRGLVEEEQVPELDGLVEQHGYDDPQVQRILSSAELQYAREVDPRPEISMGDDLRSLTERLDREIATQLERFQERASWDPETEETVNRLLQLSEEVERVRQSGDGGEALTLLTDAFMDSDGLVFTRELLGDMRELLAPYQAQFTDLVRLRQEERGEGQDWIEAMAEAIDIDTTQREIEEGRHSFEFADEEMDLAQQDEASVHSDFAEGFQLSDQDPRITYIGQREGVPYQGSQASRLLYGGASREDSMQRRLSELRSRDPDGNYEPVSYRQVVEQELADRLSEESLTPEEYQQRLEQGLAQRGQAMAERAGQDGRRVAELYDPEDPASFLDNFEMIARRPLPPQLGGGDSARFTATEFNRIVNKYRSRQDPRREQTRGTINVRVYRGEDPSAGSAERRVNLMDLATAMMDKTRGGRQGAMTTERVAQLVYDGLAALLNQPGRRVEILPSEQVSREEVRRAREVVNNPRGRSEQEVQEARDTLQRAEGVEPSTDRRVGDDNPADIRERRFSDSAMVSRIPNDTVVFTTRDGREWTWGEIKIHGTRHLQNQVDRLIAEADQTRDPEAKRRLWQEIRSLRSEIGSARGRERREQREELLQARETVQDPGASTEARQEAERIIEFHERQRELELENNFLKDELGELRAEAQRSDASPELVDFVNSLPEDTSDDFAAMMNGEVPQWADPRPELPAQPQATPTEADQQPQDVIYSGPLRTRQRLGAETVASGDFNQVTAFLDAVRNLAEKARAYEAGRTGAGQPVQRMGEAPTTFFGEFTGREYGIEARVSPQDGNWTRTQALAKRIGRTRAALKRLSKLKPGQRGAREGIWRDFGRGNPPATLDAMIRTFEAERDRATAELRDQALQEKAVELRRVADQGTFQQLRQKYELLMGEPPDPQWGVTEILRSVEPESVAEPFQRSDAAHARDQQIVDEWARNLGLQSRIRLVRMAELDEIVDPEVIGEIAAGKVHSFATPEINGEVLIHVRETITNETARVGFLAHEVGHVVYREAVNELSEGQATQIYNAYQRWLTKRSRPGTQVRTALKSKQSMAMMLEAGRRVTAGDRVKNLPEHEKQYLFDFEEWFADQVGRWLTTDKRPVGVVQRFFSRVADKLRTMFLLGEDSEVQVQRNVRALLDRMWDRSRSDFRVASRQQAALEWSFEGMPGAEPTRPETSPSEAQQWLDSLDPAEFQRTHSRMFLQRVMTEYQKLPESVQDQEQYNALFTGAMDRIQAITEESRRRSRRGETDRPVPSKHYEDTVGVLRGLPAGATLRDALEQLRPHMTEAQRRVAQVLESLPEVAGKEVLISEDSRRYAYNAVSGGFALDPDAGIRLTITETNPQGINLDPIHSVLHEGIHAATAEAEMRSPVMAARLSELVWQAQDAARERGVDFYGLSDTQEMLAEAFTNENFQRFLASVPSQREAPTLFDQLVDWIVEALGLRSEQRTLFQDILEEGAIAFETHDAEMLPDQAGDGTGQPPPPPPEPPQQPPDPDEPGPGTLQVAYTGGRFNEAAVAGYRRMFNHELGAEERKVLARAFGGEQVRRQLRRIFATDGAAKSRQIADAIDRGNVDLAFAYGMDAWMRGELELTPRPNSVMRTIHERVRRAFGILSDPERAEAYLLPLKRAEQAVLNESDLPPRFLRRTQLEQFGATLTETAEKTAFTVFRAFYGAQSRIYSTRNPVLEALTNEFQARTGRGGVRGSFFEARQLYTARYLNRFRRITEGLSEEEGQVLVELLQNPEAEFPSSMEVYRVQEIRQKADEVRQVFRQMRSYALERGLDLGDRGENYFPWVFDTDQLIQRREEFVELLNQEKYDPYLAREGETLTPQERRAAAERVYDSVMGHEGYADVEHEANEGGHLPYFSGANQRMLAWIADAGDESDQAKLASFMSKDIGYILTTYTDQLVKRAEYTWRFGTHRGEDRATLGNHARLERRLAAARRAGATDEDIEVTRKFISAVMGSYGKELAPPLRWAITTAGRALGKDWSNVDPRRIRQVQGALLVYQNFRTLALATLTSFADVGGIVVRSNDLGVAMEAFRAGLREVAIGVRNRTSNEEQYRSELRRLAESLGAIEASTINDALGELYGGMYLTDNLRRWNDTFFRAIQLQRWTRLSRMMALEAGRKFLIQHRTGVATRHSQRFLEELGLQAGDVRLTDDGADILLYSEEDRARLAAEGNREELLRDDRVRVALNRFVDQSVLRPNAAQRPIWASHPDASLVFHLKQFTYTIHDRIVRRSFQELGEGNYYPVLAMLSYLPVMIAADLLRELIQYGPDGDPRKRHWDAFDYVQEGFHRSGAAGLGTFVLDAWKDRTQFGGVGYESFAGPTLAQAGQLADALVSDGDLGSAAVRALPGNTLYREWDLEEGYDDTPWTTQANAISGWRN